MSGLAGSGSSPVPMRRVEWLLLNGDARLSIIDHRLASVSRILAFASGKGGVGKSTCATLAALVLARQGKATGLLDLDFHGASDHLILGIDPSPPEEEGGILPLAAPFGLRFMGIAPFSGEHGLALRGDAVTNAIRELLAVVIWGRLDVLVIDLPPGIGEAILDLVSALKRCEVILVSQPSTLSLHVTARLLEVLRRASVEVLGYVLNMDGREEGGSSPRAQAPRAKSGQPADERSPLADLPALGRIPYSPDHETCLGAPELLLAGAPAAAIETILEGLLG